MDLGTNNHLLLRDDIGRSKFSTRDLPGYGHSFGRPNKPDPIGVGGRKFPIIFQPTIANLPVYCSYIVLENASRETSKDTLRQRLQKTKQNRFQEPSHHLPATVRNAQDGRPQTQRATIQEQHSTNFRDQLSNSPSSLPREPSLSTAGQQHGWPVRNQESW